MQFENWKIVSYVNGFFPQTPDDWELYNLATDIDESDDLALIYPDTLEKLHKIYLKHRSLDFDSTFVTTPEIPLDNCPKDLLVDTIRIVPGQGTEIGTLTNRHHLHQLIRHDPNKILQEVFAMQHHE